MKYLLQIMAMLSDLLLGGAALVLLYYTSTHPSILMIILTAFLLTMCYSAWKDTGGIIAWTKKGRRNFSKNWDEIMKG
jgi:hypothetical protein